MGYCFLGFRASFFAGFFAFFFATFFALVSFPA